MNTGTKRTMRKSTKTTIRHLEIQKEPIGTPHTIWKCVKKSKIRYTKGRSKSETGYLYIYAPVPSR